MSTNQSLRCFIVWLSLTGLSGSAAAASLEAKAVGDLNGDFINDINDVDEVTGSPVAQTSVGVAGFGTQFGIAYDYEAAADISGGTLAAFAELTSPTDASSSDAPLLRSIGKFTDTLSFDSSLAGDYDITFLLGVSGTIENGDGRAAANALIGIAGDAVGSDFESYRSDGDHIDTLSTTVTVNGDVSLELTAQLAVEIFELGPGSTTFGDFRSGVGDHGADISILLPDDVDLAGSESGAFDATVVPLPAGLWLLLSGVLCLLPLRGIRALKGWFAPHAT